MPQPMEVKLEGLEECLKLLEMAGESAIQALEEALLEGAEVMRAEAELNAPGGEGMVKEVESKKRGEATVAVGPDKAHWFFRFFETGTTAHEVNPDEAKALHLVPLGDVIVARAQAGGMAARPFLRPAFDGKAEQAKQKFGEAIWKRIEAVLGKKS